MLQAFMPHLVAPELVESNVLAEWASHRRPRTRPERAERPQNLSAERARSGVPDISQRTGAPRLPHPAALSSNLSSSAVAVHRGVLRI